jgi:predicted alpha/beta hydrolase family esterase
MTPPNVGWSEIANIEDHAALLAILGASRKEGGRMGHITFIHGIGNKPDPETLLEQWRIALRDNDGLNLDSLGVTSSMVYWADMLYASPAPEESAQEASPLEVEQMVDAEDADLRWLDTVSDDERRFVEELGRKVGLAEVSATTDEAAPDPIVPGTPLEAVPLPPWLKKRLMRVLLRDVHHFLYDASFSPRAGETYQIRRDIRARVLTALKEAAEQPGPHLVVGHSLGSVIAYDALVAIDDAPAVDALLTVGSPLGISEVRDGLTPPWTAENGWPSQRLVDGTWRNVSDELDPVCGFGDRKIAKHYRRAGENRVTDVAVSNDGYWRHSIAKYLGQAPLRTILSEIFE